ncbi:hypothetical protein DCMF_10235 [Candidatus Formimonas warabiya]|uniref:Uncharacterized protein n=2 Tax=Formimonas warabiya TaxID=1761012 RepID=A0A3G1L159_FORW1|nr:hypothetical protein DCMF_10235 [Candidatus Formimonas warabiya]
MPVDRGIHYEDPLEEFMRSNNYGTVTGGGTMQTQDGEIQFCDLEILIYDDQDVKAVTGAVVKKLEWLGAPKGSKIKIEETNEEISFGRKEGLAIYLDGVNLPEQIYKEYDVNFVLSELSRLVGYDGDIQRFWQGNTETALYFYGESFKNMSQAVSEFVSTYPLCKGARIVQIA